MTDRTGLDEVTRRQEGGEQTLPVAEMTMACDDGPSELEEVPETVTDEREQELPEYGESEKDDDLVSLVQQPEEVEEAVGNARLVGSRGEGDGAEGWLR